MLIIQGQMVVIVLTHLLILVMSNPSRELFDVLYRGNTNLEHIQEEAIIIVGLPGVGKSTVFNLMINSPMVTQGTINTYFANNAINPQDEAKVSHDFNTETLAPNVKTKFTSDTSLIDMVGYSNHWDYLAVITFSCFWQQIAKRVKRIKFLIVIEEQYLFERSGEGIMRTFTGFFDMFDLNKMTNKMQESLLKSVGLVVTCADKIHLHKQCLKQILRKLHKKDGFLPHKANIIKLVEDICINNRLASLECANKLPFPESCSFVEQFNSKSHWSFFQIRPEAIALSFDKNKAWFEEQQYFKYDTVIQQQISHLEEFVHIFNQFFSEFPSEWRTFIEQLRQNKSMRCIIKKSFLNKVRDFVGLYCGQDKYLIEEDKGRFQVCKENETIIDLKFMTILFQAPIKEWQPRHYQFNQEVDFLLKDILDILNSLKGLVDDFDDYKLFLRLELFLSSSFTSIKQLYILYPSRCNNIIYLTEHFCHICYHSQQFYYFVWFNQISEELYPKLFTNLTQLNDLSNLLLKYQQSHQKQQNFQRQQGMITQQSVFEKIRFNIQKTRQEVMLIHAKQKQNFGSLIKTLPALTHLGRKPQECFDIEEYVSKHKMTQECGQKNKKIGEEESLNSDPHIRATIQDLETLKQSQPIKINPEARIQYPLSAVGLLLFQNSHRIPMVGTAFLIRRNILLTCAHNCFSIKTKSFYKKMQFVPSLIQPHTHVGFRVKWIYLPRQYLEYNLEVKSKNNRGHLFDFAIILLDTQLNLERYFGSFGYDFSWEENSNKNTRDMSVTGFYHSYGETIFNSVEGQVLSDINFLLYTTKTKPGMSGSPLYEIVDGKMMFRGIHTKDLSKLFPGNVYLSKKAGIKLSINMLGDLQMQDILSNIFSYDQYGYKHIQVQVMKPKAEKSSTPILFTRSQKGQFAFLSNSYPSSFTVNNIKFASLQHYFQYQKFPGHRVATTILQTQTAEEVFRLGQSRYFPLRKDWEQVKEKLMYEGMVHKFTQNQDIRQQLLNTKERQLQRLSQNDMQWGCNGKGQGKNVLGQLLMKVRKEL